MDFEIILQEYFFGGPLPKLPKRFRSANKKAAKVRNRKKNNLKLHLPLSHWPNFKTILQECSLGDPLPKLLKPFCSDEKDGHKS